MKSPNPRLRPGASGALALLLALVCFAAAPAYARGDKDWKPLEPSELSAAAAPAVEKDADAEALFWEVVVDDSQSYELSLKHYLRIKVYNERGRDSQSKVELPYYGNHQIKDIAARVIKPDGTVVELKKDDVFDRTVVKLGGVKVKVKSFALPGVEPGSVIEYRWREVHPYADANQLRLQFQRDIPVRTVTYYLKPFMGMRYRPFNMGDARFEKDKDGFSRMTMTNMPAFREEPRMPPADSVRSWVFLYYSREDLKQDAEQYWKGFGRGVYEALKDAAEGERRGEGRRGHNRRRRQDRRREAPAPLRLLPHQDQERQRRRLGPHGRRALEAQGEQVARRHAQARAGHRRRHRLPLRGARARGRLRGARRALGQQRRPLLRPRA